MSAEPSAPSLLDRLVESFMERQRRGERPTVEEYITRHPELADEIRDVFPALALMEEFGSVVSPRTGPVQTAALETAGIPGQLGEFRILREIGRGGMGVVYEAVQESLGRQVALKVLPPQLGTNPTYLERFRREAQAAARLHHTNIVPVFGVGTTGVVSYYAMQFIRGQTLEVVLAELRRFRQAQSPSPTVALAGAPLSEVSKHLLTGHFEMNSSGPSEESPPAPSPAFPEDSAVSLPSSNSRPQYFRNVAEVGVQIADALAYAHGQGVIHRDIKPSNLMLDLAGIVWVTDFGLAKAEGSADLTSPGDILGTLRYMAPEQLIGQADARSDVYSLGTTLYELVTLRPAFDDVVKARLVEQIRQREPALPHKLEPRVPRDLETIILKATAKEPERRYSSAADLAEDLRRFLADRPILARRSSWLEQGRRLCRRNKLVTGLGASLLFLLLSATIGSVIAAFVYRDKEVQAEKARTETREQLWRSLLNEGRAISLSRQPGQRLSALAKIREALEIARETDFAEADRLEFRNAVTACLLLPDIETVRTWEALEGDAAGWNRGYDFDARLERYVRSDMTGKVSVRRVADDTVIAEFPGTGTHAYVFLSPDGNRVAINEVFQGARRITIWGLKGARPEVLYQTVGELTALIAFSPDSNRIAYARVGQGFEVIDLATGERYLRKSNVQNFWRLFAFSPDGRSLAFVSQREDGSYHLRIWEAASGNYRANFPLPIGVDSLAWHPSGELMAVGGRDRRIYLYSPSANQLAGFLETHPGGGVAVHFDPSGNWLFSNDWSNQLRIWDVRSGRQILHLPAHGNVVCAGDRGGLIATQNEVPDGRLRLLRFTPGAELLTVSYLTPEGAGALGFEWLFSSPRDNLVVANLLAPVASHRSDGFALLDPASGRLLAVHARHHRRPFGFEADGSFLTTGDEGTLRWSRRQDPDGGVLRFGPPALVSSHGTMSHGAPSGDSSLMAMQQPGKLFLIRPGQPDQILAPGFENMRGCTVSPDGRWAAVGNHGVHVQGRNARVFDTQTGKLVRELETDGLCMVGFSPDSRWLWTSGGRARTWRAGSWEPGPVTGGDRMAFSNDGRVVAVGDHNGVITLRDPESGAEYVRLRIPDRERLLPMCFTRDGSRLLAYAEQSRATLIYDLRRIRAQLAELRLDWNMPEFPPPSPEKDRPLSIRLEVDEPRP